MRKIKDHHIPIIISLIIILFIFFLLIGLFLKNVYNYTYFSKPVDTASLIAQKDVAPYRSTDRVAVDQFTTKVLTIKDQIKKPVITSRDPNMGNRNASTTLVLYSDFACPDCKTQEEDLEKIVIENPNTFFIRKDFPAKNSPSYLASIAARCAQKQNKYWEYEKELRQATDLTETALLDIADQIKLNGLEFSTCLKNRDTRGLVNDNLVEAEALDLPGSPHLYINSLQFTGGLFYNDIKEAIKAIK